MEDFFIFLILGALQGIFEWIPISSEGVVALGAQFLKTNFNSVDLALFLHIGTLMAVLVYYRRDWLNVILFKDKKLFAFLLTATTVSLPLGFAMYKLVTEAAVGTGLLLITGFGLLFTAYFQKKKIVLNLSNFNLALITGMLQGLAVIPGFSRSGSTIFGLSLAKTNPKEILRLSYLMSVPAVSASTAYFLIFKSENFPFSAIWPAVFSSFLFGLLFLEAITKFGEKTNFYKFALVFAALCFAGAIIEFIA